MKLTVKSFSAISFSLLDEGANLSHFTITLSKWPTEEVKIVFQKNKICIIYPYHTVAAATISLRFGIDKNELGEISVSVITCSHNPSGQSAFALRLWIARRARELISHAPYYRVAEGSATFSFLSQDLNERKKCTLCAKVSRILQPGKV